MGRKKEEACAGCLQKCRQLHGKNKNSPTIISFFKVMIGDQFTKVLYLPPKFAAKMSKSIDQTTFLEDSQGREWKITMKTVNGTLAFDKGWSTFSSDHDLKIGDFLVFNFIVGSHFFVKIFDKSACEKEVSPINRCSRKRSRSGRFEANSCDEHDNDPLNRPGSSDIEKSSLFEEELCYVVNRGIDYGREGEKSPRANLFDLEMEKNRSRIHESASIMSGSKMGSIENNIASEHDKDSSIPPPVELKDRAHECHGVGEVRKEHSSFISNCQTVKHSIVPKFNLINPPNPIQAHSQHGEIGKIIKKERVEMTPVEAWKTIKEERDEMTPGLFEDEENLNITPNCEDPFTIKRDGKEFGLEVRNSVPSEAAFSCIVAENRSFLKLPSSLLGRGMRRERRVVFLRDSIERMWPVLYQETHGFHVLTSGWGAFCKANDIRAGQECVFIVENEAEGRYRVSIRRNS